MHVGESCYTNHSLAHLPSSYNIDSLFYLNARQHPPFISFSWVSVR